MRRLVIISLTVIVAIAATVALYLLVLEPIVGDGVGSRGGKSPLLVVRSYARRSEAVGTLSPDIALGLHVDVESLSSLDWASGRQTADEARRVVRRNLALAAKRRFNVLVLRVVDPRRPVAFFRDEALPRLGLREGPDLACLVAAQARQLKLVALVDVSGLSDHRGRSGGGPRGAGDREVVDAAWQVVRRLLARCEYDGVVARQIGSADLTALHELTLRSGKLLLHGQAEAAADADIVLGAEPVPPSGAGAALLFAHARALRRPRWLWLRPLEAAERGLASNLMLFRSVQFQLEGYLWSADSAEQVRWLLSQAGAHDQVERLVPWRRAKVAVKAKARIANLVLALPGADRARQARESFVEGVLPAVLNAMALSGLEVRATYGEVLAGAAAYVVLAIGRTPEVATRFPAFLPELLEQPRPVVLVVDGLTAEGRWRGALAKVGVRAGRWRSIMRPVPAVEYRGTSMAWHGERCSRLNCRTALLPPAAVSGETLVSVDVAGREAVLVARLGNKSLVNASVLTLQSTVVVNHLLVPTLREPFDGWGVVGPRSAFLAQQSARLAVDLPFDAGAELRLVRFGADGKRQPVEVIPYQAPLRTSLRPHELLLVERL